MKNRIQNSHMIEVVLEVEVEVIAEQKVCVDQEATVSGGGIRGVLLIDEDMIENIEDPDQLLEKGIDVRGLIATLLCVEDVDIQKLGLDQDQGIVLQNQDPVPDPNLGLIEDVNEDLP